MDKNTKNPGAGKIVDLRNYRKVKTEERRREYERVLFNRVLGVYSFAEMPGRLQHVEVVDISLSGLRFRDDKPEKPLEINFKMGIRFYFTPGSYLRLPIEIKRATPHNDDGRTKLEYGCIIDKNTKSYEAIKELVSFMQKYSEFATPDNHPPMIWF